MERQKTSFNGGLLLFLFVQHFLVFPRADADIAAKQLGEISEIRNTDGACHLCHTQRSGIEIAEGCPDPLPGLSFLTDQNICSIYNGLKRRKRRRNGEDERPVQHTMGVPWLQLR